MTWLAHRFLTALGWTFCGDLPDIPKMIITGAPHTSNWDFVLFLGALYHFDMKVNFLGKHTLFRWPFRYFFRAFGGIPVDRARPGGVVSQVKEAFDAVHELILVVAPEGTRRPLSHWKSGFIKIAEGVGVPIVFAAVDFSRKQVTLSPMVEYDGSVSRFMDRAREFYADKVGRHPENKGPVRVKEEDVS